MVIESAARQYVITAVVSKDETAVQYLGEDREQSGKYQIFILKSGAETAGTVGFLYDELEKRSFQDFMDCFVWEEKLCLVFCRYVGDSLKEKLERERLNLAERLDLGSKLLERMVLLDMSFYFQKGALSGERIHLSPALSCSFEYCIDGLKHCRESTMPEVLDRLGAVFSLLFEQERENRPPVPLDEFLRALPGASFKSYMEIYEAYQNAKQKTSALSEAEQKRPKPWSFRMWAQFRKLFGVIKHLLALALLLAAVLYTVRTVRQAGRPAAEAVTMTRIGTVDLGDFPGP